mmetsp:Transcript_15319/g.48830  ORF Transcript_15319/g.48830 Transcript_15319/m.48830 type:complete len:482 (+) Transcript_15319:428-1873(+)
MKLGHLDDLGLGLLRLLLAVADLAAFDHLLQASGNTEHVKVSVVLLQVVFLLQHKLVFPLHVVDALAKVFHLGHDANLGAAERDDLLVLAFDDVSAQQEAVGVVGDDRPGLDFVLPLLDAYNELDILRDHLLADLHLMRLVLELLKALPKLLANLGHFVKQALQLGDLIGLFAERKLAVNLLEAQFLHELPHLGVDRESFRYVGVIVERRGRQGELFGTQLFCLALGGSERIEHLPCVGCRARFRRVQVLFASAAMRHTLMRVVAHAAHAPALLVTAERPFVRELRALFARSKLVKLLEHSEGLAVERLTSTVVGGKVVQLGLEDAFETSISLLHLGKLGLAHVKVDRERVNVALDMRKALFRVCDLALHLASANLKVLLGGQREHQAGYVQTLDGDVLEDIHLESPELVKALIISLHDLRDLGANLLELNLERLGVLLLLLHKLLVLGLELVVLPALLIGHVSVLDFIHPLGPLELLLRQ